MSDDPVLHVEVPQRPVTAVALVLHGGRSRSTAATHERQLAVLRMRPFASSLHAVGAAHGLAVARLRFRLRGWNGSDASPVGDAEWALDRLADRFAGAPIALVGHSMGGRTAVYAGGHPTVTTVVGLAPWLEPGDPYRQLAERRVLFVHGDRDRMTSPPESAAYAERLRAVARSVSYVSMHGAKHAMLRHASRWHELTTAYVLALLCNRPPAETVRPESAKIVEKVLAGAQTLVA